MRVFSDNILEQSHAEGPEAWWPEVRQESVYWPMKLDTAGIALALQVLQTEPLDSVALASSQVTQAQAERMVRETESIHSEAKIFLEYQLTPKRLIELWGDYKRMALSVLVDAWNVICSPQERVDFPRIRHHGASSATLTSVAKLLQETSLKDNSSTESIRLQKVLALAQEALHCRAAEEISHSFKAWLQQQKPRIPGDPSYGEELIRHANKLYAAAAIYLKQLTPNNGREREIIRLTLAFLEVRKGFLPVS